MLNDGILPTSVPVSRIVPGSSAVLRDAGATVQKSIGVDRMPRHTLIAFLGAAGILAGQLPAGAQTFSMYRCRDGSEFVAAFYDGDSRAHLQLDGKAVALPKRMSLSGSRYAKGGITLRITKAATTLKRGRQSTECKACQISKSGQYDCTMK